MHVAKLGFKKKNKTENKHENCINTGKYTITYSFKQIPENKFYFTFVHDGNKGIISTSIIF